MKLLIPAGCLFPSGKGNVNNKLRSEKVLSSCLRTGVRFPSAPPNKKCTPCGCIFLFGRVVIEPFKCNSPVDCCSIPAGRNRLLNVIGSPRLHQMQQRRTPVSEVRLCLFISKKAALSLVQFISMVDLLSLSGYNTVKCAVSFFLQRIFNHHRLRRRRFRARAEFQP